MMFPISLLSPLSAPETYIHGVQQERKKSRRQHTSIDPMATMSSTPIRCDFCRLHRDPATACDCQARSQRQSQSIRLAQMARAAMPNVTMTRGGRTRRREAPPSPPSSESESDTLMPSSPLARLSQGVAGFNLRYRSPPPISLTSQAESPRSPFLFGGDDEEDARIVDSARECPMLMASPPSTHVVPQTTLTQVLAQQQDQLWAGRRESEHALQEADVSCMEAAIADYATHPDPAIEIARLRQSRNGLVESLEASTAHVKRLQAKLLICAGEKAGTAPELEKAQVEAAKSLARALGWRWKGFSLARLRAYLYGSLMAVVVVYLVWLWVNAPDLAYIRKRRAEVLCE